MAIYSFTSNVLDAADYSAEIYVAVAVRDGVTLTAQNWEGVQMMDYPLLD